MCRCGVPAVNPIDVAHLILTTATADPGGLTETLQDANLPAIVLLATSGVTGVFFIVRWMMKYQREFTNFYVEENNKLRARIDQLEAEAIAKDEKYMLTRREFLAYEVTSSRQIRDMEATIERHEATIADMQRRLNDG